jgi:adenine-specific DNA methylase
MPFIDFFSKPYLLGLEKREYRNKETKLYKTPPSPERIKQVHALCEGMWGTSTPTVLDAFAGGGSIPFEAARYGLNVLASDLNPVAVVTMKAAIEFPLKFGPDLQQDIDKWVKWVGDEAEKRLAEFFPSEPNETVQNYLWAHTVVCPSCESVVPLSPNWWLYKRPEKQNLNKWCAVRPIPNLEQKRVDFELMKGKKGKGESIVLESGEEYDPSTTTTISRGVGKCPNCDSVIQDEVIKSHAKSKGLGHQLYAVAYQQGQGSMNFKVPTKQDFLGAKLTEDTIQEKFQSWQRLNIVPDIEIPYSHLVHERNATAALGLTHWDKFFNHRQLLTLVTYVEIINEVKEKLRLVYEPERVDAIAIYLALVLDRCADKNCRLCIWDSGRCHAQRASTQHALNLMWNYPEINGAGQLWQSCADAFTSDYIKLCDMLGSNKNLSEVLSIEQTIQKKVGIHLASADSLSHIDDNSLDVVITDPPYYSTIQYTENPQNLHQAQKNSVSSTVLLVCRKRDPDAGSAWWEDLRPEVANLVEQRAPEFEANDIDGIDLYLSAFGPALNVFSRHYPILNSSGEEVRPEEAFTEARKAVANYRFRKLAHIDTAGFDPLTIWYLLAWDAFRAREFPFDDARQLALAIGGFNISELKGAMKLLEVKSGTCRLLTPAQRAQKRAFSTNPDDFVLTSLVDALHATIAIYQEEQTIEPVRRFLRSTELINNDLFMRAWEVTLKVIPLIRDSKKRIPEEQALADLWLAMDEIKAKVIYVQQELDLGTVQQSLF